MNQVHRLAKQHNLTVIMVLHDLNQVSRFADEVALLVSGKIQAYAPTGEVMNSRTLSGAFEVALKVLKTQESHYPVIIPPEPDENFRDNVKIPEKVKG
jgi:ABC-type cobalamin/Fe3+-siderophores transport system ATPase subunit